MSKLLNTLIQDAAVEKEKILADAAATCREILEQAEDTVAALRKSGLEECAESLKLERGRLIGNARRQSRNLVMQAKHDVLEEAFAQAASQLAALRDRPEYVTVFERLADEALDEFGDRGPDALIVSVDARDLRICRAFFERKRIPCEIDTRKAFWGGLELASSDARFNVSNTLEGRLAREKNGLLAPVAQILFEHS